MNELERPAFHYLGHSTVRCDLPSGEVVLIDPWVSGNPACPPEHHEPDRIDAILITHAHSDHMDDAVVLAKRHRPTIVVGCYEICAWLTDQGVDNASGMNIGGKQDVLGLDVTMVRADHSSGFIVDGLPVYGGVAAGYVIRLPGGFTFYHAGDTGLFGDMRLIAELYSPDLAFLPIGDLFTMDPRQAALACRYLKVSKVIPIHWGTFPALTGTPRMLEKELQESGVACEVITLEPGDQY